MLLISTVHDPDAKLAPAARLLLPYLSTVYSGMAFCVTDKTHPDTIRAFGSSAIVNQAEGPANGRRCALSLGLQTIYNTFHYCDGDRILFWAWHYPDELCNIVKRYEKAHCFVVLGRTKKAFSTHPLFQRLTENLVNLSTLSGKDYLSGSRIIPRPIALKILEASTDDNAAALDLEWPLIARDFIYTEVDGLAYEHKFFGLEKPFKVEAKTRITNMISSIKVQWQE